MNVYEYEKNTTYKIFIFTIYAYLIYTLLPYLDILISFSYISKKLHGLILSLMPILIILEIVLFIYFSTLSGINKENIDSNNKKVYKYFKNLLLFLTIIISTAFFIFEEFANHLTT